MPHNNIPQLSINRRRALALALAATSLGTGAWARTGPPSRCAWWWATPPGAVWTPWRA